MDSDQDYQQALEKVRQKIDKVDESILLLLRDRNVLVDEVFNIKKANNLPIRQRGRYQSMVAELSKKAQALGVDLHLVYAVWEIIHEQSVKKQEALEKSEQQ